MIHTAGGDYVRPDVGAYAEGPTAIAAEGKLAKAGAFGVEIADLHSKLTHASVLFCTSEYGAFGEMRWLAMYGSAAAVDGAAEFMAKDEDYGKKLDAAGDLFVEGVARRTLARRISLGEAAPFLLAVCVSWSARPCGGGGDRSRRAPA